MARGTKGAEALDMSKFFDTNYHYLVPELAASVAPKPDFSTFIAKARPLALAPSSAILRPCNSRNCLDALAPCK